MVFNQLAMILVGLTIFFPPGANSDPCPTGLVAVNVTSSADIENLTDVISCTGQGDFNVTWYSSLTLGQSISVHGLKNVTITGVAFPTIHGGLGDDNDGGAGGGTGIFSVSDRSTLSLNKMVLAGGKSENGAAVNLVSHSSLFVYDCNFTAHNASNGGAIYSSFSSVDVSGSTTFNNNYAFFGGAIYAIASNVSISGYTSFGYNTVKGAFLWTTGAPSSFGGAIYAMNSRVHTDGENVFAGNFATGTGGAVFGRESEVHMKGNTYFEHNTAGDNGGAVYGHTSEVCSDGNTYFKNNTSDRAGGAMSFWYGEVHIKGETTFDTNKAHQGGGGAIETYGTEVNIEGSTSFMNNWASQHGGAINVRSSKVYIEGNTSFVNNGGRYGAGAMHCWISTVFVDGITSFFNNWADSVGGAMVVDSTEMHLAANMTFVNNSADAGGAMDVSSSPVYMEGFNVFVNNSADSGGAMYVDRSSEFYMEGSTFFVANRADTGGGAIFGESSSLFFNGSMIPTGGQVGNQGDEYRGGEDKLAIVSDIRFIGNTAGGLGGAMHVNGLQELRFQGVAFESNYASLGGAIYIASTEDRLTEFSACVFEGNVASDGGATYLATGAGVDMFTACLFHDNYAEFSGGAIFHTASLRVVDTSFVANKVGVEGPAIISIGFIQQLSNVSFSENSFHCRAEKYSHELKHEDDVCRACFDEVCARCFTEYVGDSGLEDVRTNGLPVCIEPPTGAIAEFSGTTVATLSLEKGYYRTSNQSHDVLKCYHSDACLGGNDATNYCAPGYKGPYCAVCVDGYTPGIAYSCYECSRDIERSAVGRALAVGLAGLLMVGFLFARLGSVVPEGTGEDTREAHISSTGKCWSCQNFVVNFLPLRAIKIVVTVWQIISQFGTIAGQVYPKVYTAFVAKLTPFNLDLDIVLSYSCIITTDFYDHLLLATIAPALVIVTFAGSYLVAKNRNNGTDSATRTVLHKHQAAALYLAFFVYSPVSYKIFQTFACDELDDGESYLRADYSLSCLTPRHRWFTGYALVMVGIYPIGIAAVFAFLLARYRHDLVKPSRDSIPRLRPFHGMWAAYKPSRYFYEVVECARRISLTVIAALVPSNSTAQISIVLLFAVVFVFISEAISPFDKGADMNLYRWGNAIIVASMYVAFLMQVDVGYDTDNALLTFSGVLILANVFMVITVLVQTAFLIKEWHRTRELPRAVDEPVRRTE